MVTDEVLRGLREQLTALRSRLKEAEAEIGRMRGRLRGLIWKLQQGRFDSVLQIIERLLSKSARYYPHPIAEEPEDPTEVKR